ncbi:alpha/beta hydrolase [Agromyces ramosus]|uniref:Acetyl esterase n=1 Tax=Agromyces ramosus TaxID=33879 RepID=A0ABU0RD06_9MICO|nr:alpha/beta hydrolase fold domain-containing protein [Agromyces ramosus]MDQ0895952.1 acetyl esterase [Agromyces ramosus]
MSESFGAADGLVRVYPAGEPTLVWAHGGGFAGGDLDMPEADWVARALSERGISVITVDYRHAGGGFHYPVPSDDILTAWHWTLEHVDELGIDPARLAIGGASAGGNLVTGAVLRMLADETRPRQLPGGVFLAYPTLLAEQPPPDAALRALLDANPEVDRSGPARVRSMYEGYFGKPVDDAPLSVVPGEAAASDLAGFPPVLMINSEIDELRVSGEVFAATLVEAGVPLELVMEARTAHGHLNRPDEPAASVSIERVATWIGRGFLPAATDEMPRQRQRQ